MALAYHDADHREVERNLLAAGWTPCGAGDWAIALRSPDGMTAAWISPFDPTGPYDAALYRQAEHTRQVPQLFTHHRLLGGGDLQVMEWLRRFMTEIPLATSGPWETAAREMMRTALALADARPSGAG